jgi:hypothetical protein
MTHEVFRVSNSPRKRKYDHAATPDPMARKGDGNIDGVLCIECYAPIHAAWTYVGPRREPDLRWRHTGFR